MIFANYIWIRIFYMEIIGEIKNTSGHTVFKMFISKALPRKNNFRHHKHTEFEFSLILSGSGNYKIGGKVYDIQKNDVFIFGTNEQHCITDIEEGGMNILNIHIQPSYMWDTNSINGKLNFMKVFFDRNNNFTNRIDRNNPVKKEIISLINNIKIEFLNKKPDYEIIIKQYAVKSFVLIMREFNYVNLNLDIDIQQKSLKKIKEAVNFINDNYLETITLEEVAAKVFMNKSYFCTLFKKYNGITPWEYILIKRTEKAIDLLKTTDDNILNIALQCGFNNTANFNKIFKKITGTVPKLFKHD